MHFQYGQRKWFAAYISCISTAYRSRAVFFSDRRARCVKYMKIQIATGHLASKLICVCGFRYFVIPTIRSSRLLRLLPKPATRKKRENINTIGITILICNNHSAYKTKRYELWSATWSLCCGDVGHQQQQRPIWLSGSIFGCTTYVHSFACFGWIRRSFCVFCGCLFEFRVMIIIIEGKMYHRMCQGFRMLMAHNVYKNKC